MLPHSDNKRKRSDQSVEKPDKRFCSRSDSGSSNGSSLSLPMSPSERPERIHNILEKHRLQPYIELLPWALQWEIARAHQTGRMNLDSLEVSTLKGAQNLGTAQAMDRFRQNLPSTSSPESSNLSEQERKLKLPWEELDKELQYRCQTTTNNVESSTYHGKVHFTAQITSGHNSELQLTLERPSLGNSTRFAREFGSEAIIRIKLNSNQLSTERFSKLKPFLKSEFVLFGRHFRAYSSKDGTVFLVWVASELHPRRPSLFNVLNWHNPVILNRNQPVAKWAARFQLGHSTTVPAFSIPSDMINELGDFDGETRQLVLCKLEANQCMTDGCGYASLSLLQKVKEFFNLSTTPTAVQFRYGGAKGLALLHPKNRDPDAPPTMWLRPSQVKIIYDVTVATATQKMLEIVTPTRLITPARLSPQTIINLGHNGVSSKAFIRINNAAMQETYDALTEWEGRLSMQKLYQNIESQGRVMAMRMARMFADNSRIWGQRDRKEVESSLGEFDDETSTAWFPDPISGCPSTLEESALGLLSAGFNPQKCMVLAKKLKQILIARLNMVAQNYRIPLKMSAIIHIAPVPEEYKDCLKEDEVHLLSSSNDLLQNGEMNRTITGEVLVARYPCLLPSDIQKVKVVTRPELSQYTDILLMPIQSARSLASMLAGGDYDGDTVLLIWHPEIVDSFKPPSSAYADAPHNFDDNFEGKTVMVTEILENYPDLSSSQEQQELLSQDLQDALLDGISRQTAIAKYSDWHSKAVDRQGYGYANPETIRLAHMFCAVMDALKTGKRVRKLVYEADSQKWDVLTKAWWNYTLEKDKNYGGNKKFLDGGQTPVMSSIQKASQNRQKELLHDYGTKLDAAYKDQDLCSTWEEEDRRVADMENKNPVIGAQMRRELESIQLHVKTQHSRSKTHRTTFLGQPITERQDILRSESRAFASGPVGCIIYPDDAIKWLRASYAYKFDAESKGGCSQWPWNVAFRTLCEIKCKTEGTIVADGMAQFLKMRTLKDLPTFLMD